MNKPPSPPGQHSSQVSETSNSVVFQTISDDQSGQRIDNYLLCYLKGVPRSHVYRVLRRGEVRVNKGRVQPTYRLQTNDVVRIPPTKTTRAPDNAGRPRVKQSLMDVLEQRVLFEDKGLLIINKPSGLAVHGGSGVSMGLIEALRVMRPDCEGLELVHRLDKETSGCVMLAKKRTILRELHELLRDGKGGEGGKIDKIYCALVHGRWQGKAHLIDAPLKKNVLSSGERIVRVSSEGKVSQTKFKIMSHYAEASLVEAMPITGRTHQIRVHAQFAGHPILGDTRYGLEEANKLIKEKGLNRLFLHAKSLKFKLASTGQAINVTAPLDVDLKNVLDTLGKL